MKVQFLTKCRIDGFALVSTILVMILMIIVALGLLTLSTITLRTGSQSESNARAQANARIALMIAIGELQKEMGPDQRISAKGEILSPDSSTIRNRHWTGVWNSWEAGEGESSQHSTIVGVTDEMAPTYLPNRSDYFRKWLVSLDPDEADNILSPLELDIDGKVSPLGSDTAVKLVSEGSLGPITNDLTPEEKAEKSAEHVNARLLNVQNPESGKISGRYGWWVGDESQKARVMDDSYAAQSALTKVEKIYRSQAPASTGTKTVRGLETLADDSHLKGLLSLASTDLLIPNSDERPAQKNFHNISFCSSAVLADVREGGLKRDLSTLLERPINTAETGDEFMLYRFDDQGEARVPIQDLAAYYQLYYNDPSWTSGRRGGVNYDKVTGKFEIKVPDYGDPSPAGREKHLRQYTSIYSSPVPVRIQFVLAMGATPITDAERVDAKPPSSAIDPTDTHKLVLGVVPVLSLWNPNNVPLVIDQGNTQIFKLCAPPFGLRWQKNRAEGDNIVNGPINLSYALSGQSSGDGRATREAPYIMQFMFGQTQTVRFEPGEVKIFSFPSGAADKLSSGLDGIALNSARYQFEPENRWDPYGVFPCLGSARTDPPTIHAKIFPSSSGPPRKMMVFKASDRINVEIASEGATLQPIAGNSGGPGMAISRMSEVSGAGLNFWMSGIKHEASDENDRFQTDHFRNYQALSRFGGTAGFNGGGANNSAFNLGLMTRGFPDENPVIKFEDQANSVPGSQIIAATASGEVMSFMVFSLMAGCEAHSSKVGGYAAGRKTATRPFLHGAAIAAPLIDNASKTALYDSGWEWQVDKINSIEEAIQMDPGTGNTFHGGGYTVEAGTTHVVQQHLPVLPPISIAALSFAHLGGFSLANQPVVGGANENVPMVGSGTAGSTLRDADDPKAFQVVTATGAAGLAPHVMQAVGNSYAHPNIPADKTSTTYLRDLNLDASPREIPYVDHSYLANKALWDEYFFSSMVAQPGAPVTMHESKRDLAKVAEDFFADRKPLPNRRIVPYKNHLDDHVLSQLLSQANLYSGGLADKIAAHLMVEGAFNVNSTSVEAWKIFLSSLKNKPVSYLNEDSANAEHIANGVNVSGGALKNGAPVKTSEISESNTPPQQWLGGRELMDKEIEELARAMVNQVKLRGPFLSLSEFVNRRLQSGLPFANKGALQAALDDPSVSINANFRTASRMLDTETAAIVDFKNPDAAKGPIAYGSAAYVDQADILGHFAEQLTPRGDTFVIRTYGDALDAKGNVIARAWCEAVVQRVPEYVNFKDEAHLKPSDLTEMGNKTFGRKIQIIQFRWLNADEV